LLALRVAPVRRRSRPSNRFRRVFEAAAREAERLKDDYVSTEHFLLALADDAETGAAGQTLRRLGVTRDRLYEGLQAIRGGQRVTSATPETTYQSLEKYGRDLTALAREGKLDPVIGRDEEVRRVIQVLSRRTKNNPVLIGEPGVGKTAIVEGLAQRIVRGDVPEDLKDKRIVRSTRCARGRARSIAASSRSASRRSSRESPTRPVASSCSSTSCTRSSGAGPPRGRWTPRTCSSRCLPAASCTRSAPTTLDEYRKHIEKDAASSAASSRCTSASPPSRTRSASLRGLRERYEQHHRVRIKDSALVAAAVLSHRYIADRFLPDKAIDLVDEAAAKLRMEATSMPIELDEVRRRIMQLEIEREGPAQGEGQGVEGATVKLEKELADAKEEAASSRPAGRARSKSSTRSPTSRRSSTRP
jgi:ATP-dependent Clp protease ATP-binding subunit ClpB